MASKWPSVTIFGQNAARGFFKDPKGAFGLGVDMAELRDWKTKVLAFLAKLRG